MATVLVVSGLFVLLVVCALPWIVRVRTGVERNLLEPIYPMSVSFFLLFGLKPLALLIGIPGVFLSGVSENLLENDPAFATAVLLGAAAGFAALWIGYLCPVGSRLGKTVWDRGLRLISKGNGWPNIARLIAVGAVGSAAVVYLSVSKRVHPSISGNTYDNLVAWDVNALATTATFLWVAVGAGLILILSEGGQDPPRFGRRLVASMVMVSLLTVEFGMVFFSTGARWVVVQLLASSVAVYYYTKAKKRIGPGGLLLCLALLVGTFYVADFYRLGTTRDLGELAGSFLQVAVGGVAALAQRMIGFEALGVVMNLTPDVLPPLRGETMAGLLYGWVPRLVWPDKPPISSAYYFTTGYLGEAPDTPTSAAMTVAGDLYMNFLWPGLITGMFLVGVVLRAYAVLAGRCGAGDRRALLLYGTALPHLVNVEWSLALWVTGVVKVSVLAIVAGRLMFSNRGR